MGTRAGLFHLLRSQEIRSDTTSRVFARHDPLRLIPHNAPQTSSSLKGYRQSEDSVFSKTGTIHLGWRDMLMEDDFQFRLDLTAKR